MDLGAQHRKYLHAGLDLLADVLLLRDGLNAAAQLKRLHLRGEIAARAVKVGDAAQAEPLAQHDKGVQEELCGDGARVAALAADAQLRAGQAQHRLGRGVLVRVLDALDDLGKGQLRGGAADGPALREIEDLHADNAFEDDLAADQAALRRADGRALAQQLRRRLLTAREHEVVGEHKVLAAQRLDDRDFLRLAQRLNAVFRPLRHIAAGRELRGAVRRNGQLDGGARHDLARVERADLQRADAAAHARLGAALVQPSVQRLLDGKRVRKALEPAAAVGYVQKRHAQRAGNAHAPVRNLAAAHEEAAAALHDARDVGAVIGDDGLGALLACLHKRRQSLITGIRLFAQFKLHGSPLLWHGFASLYAPKDRFIPARL